MYIKFPICKELIDENLEIKWIVKRSLMNSEYITDLLDTLKGNFILDGNVLKVRRFREDEFQIQGEYRGLALGHALTSLPDMIWKFNDNLNTIFVNW